MRSSTPASSWPAMVVVHSFVRLFHQADGPSEELYLLILIATTGSAVLVSASHFASLFLGLEILSVPLYALIGYKQSQKQPLEAAIKYLVLAAVSAAFLLFGMALVYAELGTMQFDQMAKAVTRPDVNMALLPRLRPDRSGLRFQAGGRPIPPVDARCLSGRAGAGHRVRRHGFQGRDGRASAALFLSLDGTQSMRRCSPCSPSSPLPR